MIRGPFNSISDPKFWRHKYTRFVSLSILGIFCVRVLHFSNVHCIFFLGGGRCNIIIILDKLWKHSLAIYVQCTFCSMEFFPITWHHPSNWLQQHGWFLPLISINWIVLDGINQTNPSLAGPNFIVNCDCLFVISPAL